MKIQTVIRNPREKFHYVLKKIKQNLFWDFYYNSLRKPKVKKFYVSTPQTEKTITDDLLKHGFKLINLKIDKNDYRNYLTFAEYKKYTAYYKAIKKDFLNKTLEHYIAAKLLNLNKDDIFMDIACAHSPAAKIYQKLFQCRVYQQDLEFPEGIHGNIIGGNASDLPLENESVTKISLHCSFEHFEQNSDVEFIKEANRVLCKGGKLCIVPLYLATEYLIQTDPSAVPYGGISYEDNAILYCSKGWGWRHGRFYSVPQLIKRIKNNLNGMKLKIFVIQNKMDFDPTCYIKFIGFFEKS
ncbi:MAG: methyltransferase domain-containing protein [Candidatus Bathyarchaeota archaeon]